jgi:hypothetical protein
LPDCLIALLPHYLITTLPSWLCDPALQDTWQSATAFIFIGLALARARKAARSQASLAG